MPTSDIVQKLWNLCHVLRDDGITYHQYVTELTWLLFLKMAKETGTEQQLPKGYRWADLEARDPLNSCNVDAWLNAERLGRAVREAEDAIGRADAAFRGELVDHVHVGRLR